MKPDITYICVYAIGFMDRRSSTLLQVDPLKPDVTPILLSHFFMAISADDVLLPYLLHPHV